MFGNIDTEESCDDEIVCSPGLPQAEHAMLAINNPRSFGLVRNSQGLGLLIVCGTLFQVHENAIRNTTILSIDVVRDVGRALLREIALVSRVLVIIATAHKRDAVEGRGIHHETENPPAPLLGERCLDFDKLFTNLLCSHEPIIAAPGLKMDGPRHLVVWPSQRIESAPRSFSARASF